MPVYLTAFIKSKAAHTAAVKAALENLVAQARKEPACIRYDLYQDAKSPETFIFSEIWASQEGLDEHNSQPYIQALGSEEAAALLDGPVVIHQMELLAKAHEG